MLHVWFDGFGVFYTSVLFALMPSGQGQSAVIGPVQPIVAILSDDIILPCSLSSTTDASHLPFEWNRPDLESRLVHVWPERAELQNPSYKGRTSLFINELKHGNISLKISKVKLSDEGTYRCFVPDLQRVTAVRLVVGAASSPASSPVTKMNRTSSRVELQCESAGWYPEPELLWLDGEGNLLPAGPTETLRGPDGLYTVSSRVTVEKRHSNNFTCRVQQKNINQSRETHIHVPDDFFMVISPSSPPSDPTTDSNTAGVVIGVVVVLLLILAVFFVVWKRRQDKCRNKKSEEDRSHVEVEEGQSEPLRAGREEEDDVDSRGEQSNKDERKIADDTELKYKNHHPKEEKTQERSEEESEDEEHGEGNERESLGMTERKTEEQSQEETTEQPEEQRASQIEGEEDQEEMMNMDDWVVL